MLDFVLSQSPRVIYLSSGDPRPFAKRILQSKSRLICEARSIADCDLILETGAEVIVLRGQGEEGANSAQTTFSLIPEASDYLYSRDDEVILVASGGVMDARGMAAMITLGADGVCIGRRLWSTKESPIDGAELVEAIAPHGQLLSDQPSVQPMLRKIGSQAERILSHMPRKIVKEPPGPGATGELSQEFVLENLAVDPARSKKED